MSAPDAGPRDRGGALTDGPNGARVPSGGFLNLNKPAGMTSMDVVRVVKRLTGVRKVGHGGTLDPDATGVLPVCFGRGTRFIERFVGGIKAYQAVARFGTATDTYDASGRVTAGSDPDAVTRGAVESALPAFRGEISQVPPMFSAVKKDGVRLYKLARAGEEVEREARRVTVHALELTSWDPPCAGLRIECGSGFYARSLVHDLAASLGSTAHLSSLVRTRVGPFELDGSSTLEQLETAAAAGGWGELAHPIDTALADLDAVVLDPVQEEAVSHGQAVLLPSGGAGGRREPAEVRAYGRSGEFLALMRYDPVLSSLTPVRVVAAN